MIENRKKGFYGNAEISIKFSRLKKFCHLNVSVESNEVSNIILNSVRQHNHFIIEGNYKVTCFEYSLVILRPILFQLCHKTLCKLCDPIVCTSMEYIKLNRLSLRV